MSTVRPEKAKPCWSEAFFFRSGGSGMLYDFKFYQGKNTGICAKYNKLGLGESVMMRVVENLPQNENVKVYFDNFSLVYHC